MGKDDIFILSPPAREILDALVEPNFPQAPLCFYKSLYTDKSFGLLQLNFVWVSFLYQILRMRYMGYVS